MLFSVARVLVLLIAGLLFALPATAAPPKNLPDPVTCMPKRVVRDCTASPWSAACRAHLRTNFTDRCRMHLLQGANFSLGQAPGAEYSGRPSTDIYIGRDGRSARRGDLGTKLRQTLEDAAVLDKGAPIATFYIDHRAPYDKIARVGLELLGRGLRDVDLVVSDPQRWAATNRFAALRGRWLAMPAEGITIVIGDDGDVRFVCMGPPGRAKHLLGLIRISMTKKRQKAPGRYRALYNRVSKIRRVAPRIPLMLSANGVLTWEEVAEPLAAVALKRPSAHYRTTKAYLKAPVTHQDTPVWLVLDGLHSGDIIYGAPLQTHTR